MGYAFRYLFIDLNVLSELQSSTIWISQSLTVCLITDSIASDMYLSQLYVGMITLTSTAILSRTFSFVCSRNPPTEPYFWKDVAVGGQISDIHAVLNVKKPFAIYSPVLFRGCNNDYTPCVLGLLSRMVTFKDGYTMCGFY